MWKLKRIHISFNFSSKNKNQVQDHKIDELLNKIRDEITVATQAFFAWKSIHNVTSKDKKTEQALNSNALSWNIYLHSLQNTFFITIGRLFDTNSQSCSIHLLFRQCKNSINEFSKSSLRRRRIKDTNNIKPDYLDDFISNTYEPKLSDFKKLKKNISRVQRIYEQHFRPVRHKVFAHNDADYIANNSELFSGVMLNDAEDILKTLYKVEKVIWDLYMNGKKMNYDYWELNEEEHILKDTESLLSKVKI